MEQPAQFDSSQKSSFPFIPVAVSVVLTALVVGGGIFWWMNQKQQWPKEPVSTQNNSVVSQIENIKEYRNNTYGYKIQYPSFFDVSDSKPNNVDLSNTTCEPNNKLCFLGVDSISIYVSDNFGGMGFDAKYNELKKNNNSCKQLSIFPLPENFNESELVKAVRCEFPEVPKQAKGGYSYTILHNNKIFEITFYQGDSTVTVYVNGSLLNIAKDNYDPIGDVMMRTFGFTKQSL